MKATYIIIILLTTASIISCGNASGLNNEEKSTDTSLHCTAASTSSTTKHETDNFYAINDGGKFQVGNNIDILNQLPITGDHLIISPNGKYVAYTANTPDSISQIHIYNIATKHDETIDFDGKNTHTQSFSPDGNYLAISYMIDAKTCIAALYNITTKKFTQVPRPSNGHLLRPTFSPDGEYLVCHDMCNAYIYTFKNGIAKYWKSISCANLCINNGHAINCSCKLQMTPKHDYIIYTCGDYSNGNTGRQLLNAYKIDNAKVQELLPNNKTCSGFDVSSDGTIYFLMNDTTINYKVYLTTLSDDKPVKISDKIFKNGKSIKVAY